MKKEDLQAIAALLEKLHQQAVDALDEDRSLVLFDAWRLMQWVLDYAPAIAVAFGDTLCPIDEVHNWEQTTDRSEAMRRTVNKALVGLASDHRTAAAIYANHAETTDRLSKKQLAAYANLAAMYAGSNSPAAERAVAIEREVYSRAASEYFKDAEQIVSTIIVRTIAECGPMVDLKVN